MQAVIPLIILMALSVSVQAQQNNRENPSIPDLNKILIDKKNIFYSYTAVTYYHPI
jgi:hypothetical protein